MDPLARLRPLVHRVPAARRRWVAAALVAVAVLALAVPVGLTILGRGAASSGSNGASTSTRGSLGSDTGFGSAGTPQAPAEGKALAPGASTGSGASSGTSGSNGSSGADAAGSSVLDALPADLGVRLARTAWLGVKVGDLAAASARARVTTSEAGGVVTFENVVTATDPTGLYGAPDGVPSPGSTGTGTTSEGSLAAQPVGVDEARMVLSIPADKLDGVLTELSGLGSVSYRSSQSEDVTETYVDAQARVQPARDSITRVRALLAKATDLQQVVLLESELSRRQADLDSLVRRLADLERRTTYSDVTLTMWTAATTPVVAATGDDITSRLRGAWEGLLTSATVILTGLAALLPWIVVIGLGVLVVMRVRRRRTVGSPVPAVATAGASGASGAAGAPSPTGAGGVGDPGAPTPTGGPNATGTPGGAAAPASDD
ncbi:DUF4349 domain-containing protein [Intrasporangium sp. YIM S08009]|uniref:DUF4349 domain-containing protein n=1 Tax=Intrasporangium zincisolvens TaxID=3080018 RepID=UPI002B057B46|nr:DUF4349 domain-containing protein [Intrasporangium sp. YIM S08009]